MEQILNDAYCLYKSREETWCISPLDEEVLTAKKLAELWYGVDRYPDPFGEELSDEGAPIENQFHEHAEKWSRETGHISSISKMVMHPSYQKIIKMGWDVVPLLLEDLQRHGRFWFWALASITEENPVVASQAGNIPQMKESWLEWGR